MNKSHNKIKTFMAVSGRVVGVLLFFAANAFFIATTIPTYVRMAPAFVLKDVPRAVLKVKAPGDPIASTVIKTAPELPGYADLVVQESRGRAFAAAMDGWLWRIDLKTGKAARFLNIPLQGGGMRAHPTDPNILFFCASRLFGKTFPKDRKVGIYELRIAEKRIQPVLIRVPLPPKWTKPPAGNTGIVYPVQSAPGLLQNEMNARNSRDVAYCNDLAVSRDAKRFYMSESLDHSPTGFGSGYAFQNFVTLGRRGRLWLFDRESKKVSLMAQGYTFVDGVTLEAGTGKESSVLFSENPRARIIRAHIAGAKAGKDEIVAANLPGLTDGLSRDAAGNLWAAQVGPRSGALAFVYRFVWLKYLLARLPPGLASGESKTGILRFSPDGSKPLYYTMHDGSKLRGITKVIPVSDGVYLSASVPGYPGLFKLPIKK